MKEFFDGYTKALDLLTQPVEDGGSGMTREQAAETLRRWAESQGSEIP